MEIDTSSTSVVVGALVAIVGILVLILAFAMNMGDLVMVLGLIIAVVGVVIFYLKPLDGSAGVAKPKAPAAKAAPAKAAAAKPAKDYGNSQLGKALTFAEQKLNEKEDSMPASIVEFYRGKIAAYADAVGKDEESALIGMSQVIGAIVSA